MLLVHLEANSQLAEAWLSSFMKPTQTDCCKCRYRQISWQLKPANNTVLLSKSISTRAHLRNLRKKDSETMWPHSCDLMKANESAGQWGEPKAASGVLDAENTLCITCNTQGEVCIIPDRLQPKFIKGPADDVMMMKPSGTSAASSSGNQICCCWRNGFCHCVR